MTSTLKHHTRKELETVLTKAVDHAKNRVTASESLAHDDAKAHYTIHSSIEGVYWIDFEGMDEGMIVKRLWDEALIDIVDLQRIKENGLSYRLTVIQRIYDDEYIVGIYRENDWQYDQTRLLDRLTLSYESYYIELMPHTDEYAGSEERIQ